MRINLPQRVVVNQKILLSVLFYMFALLYLIIAMHLPVSIYTTANHDDAWFVKNAENILRGHWFGNFDHMTLIKGPAYSYFLSLNYIFGLPLTFTTSLLYVIACIVLISGLRRAGLEASLAIGLFALLLFQPALFQTRIIRDNIYYSLTLLSFAGIVYISLEKRAKVKSLYVALLGMSTGFFWITREEGIWIFPGATLLIGYSIIKRFKKKSELFYFLKTLTGFFIWAVLPILASALISYSKYGFFQVVDVKSSAFVNALNALNSVKVGEEVPFVPVPQKKRLAIYDVSPAFKELESFFEGTGKGWMKPGCKVYPHTCGDYVGGWFMWALRDGVSRLGYYSNPKSASEYFNRLTTEINSACKRGELGCTKSLVPYMPKLPHGTFSSIPEKASKAVRLTLYRTDVPINGGPSWLPLARLIEIRDFLGNPRITISKDDKIIKVSGWYYQTNNKWLSLSCDTDGLKSLKELQRQNSPDIAMYFNNSSAVSQRFSFQVKESANCVIQFDGGEYKPLKLSELLNNPTKFLNTNSGVFHLDEIKLTTTIDTFNDWSSIKKYLIKIYKNISIWIFSVGMLSFFATAVMIIFRKSRLDYLTVIATGLWLMYFSRIALVILVDISSFPAINHLYLMPAFPILFAASFVTFSSLLKAIKGSKINNAMKSA
jgi:hypothetical protein